MSFTTHVKEYFQTQDALRQLQAEAKVIRDPIKEKLDNLKASVIDYMSSSDIDQCNYHDERLELHRTTKTNSLSKKTLKTALEDIFVNNPTEADSMFDRIMDSLGSKEVMILKRIKPRKRNPTAKKKPSAKKMKVESDNDDDESDDDSDSAAEEAGPPVISEDD